MHSTLVCLCFIQYAQFISVHLFYIVYTVHRCVFVLYRLWLLFLLAVYRMSVQSILIAYFYRCVQCTRYYCQCIYIFIHGNGLCDCYFYHLSQFTFSKCAVSVSSQPFLLFFCFLFFFVSHTETNWRLL